MQIHNLFNYSILANHGSTIPDVFRRDHPAMPWPPRVEAADGNVVALAPLAAHGQPVANTEANTRTTTAMFITPQSLVAFPFASGLVAAIWRATAMLLPPAVASSPWTGLVIAIFIGSIVYGISVTDRRVQLTKGEKLIGLAIALINCLYLFMAAVGISSGISISSLN
jgi:hypothetical protein